jgi:hypothetical protein
MTPLPPARHVALVMRIYNGKEKHSAGIPAGRTRRFGTPVDMDEFE